jgi:hypothetical protein
MTSPWIKTVLCLVAIGLSGISVFGQQPSPSISSPAQGSISSKIFRGGKDDLQKQSFHLSGLNISIRSYHLLGLGDLFDIRAENPSKGILKFNPIDLAVVDASNYQALMLQRQVLCEIKGAPIECTLLPQPFPIFPGAFTKATYVVNSQDNLKFPIKIFLGGEVIAEISN